MEGIFPLLMAAAFWIATHNGFAGTDIRARLVAKIGENGFRIAYATISVIAIMMLARAWEGAVAMPLWTAPAWLRLILALVMLPAFLFFVAGFLRNPTAVG
ncbi:MAG: NnrU family protein, partial [Alphaproteobacteria bacterium]